MENQVDFQLDPPLKGARDYLHSTTIYRFLASELNDRFSRLEPTGVKLMFKGMIRGGVDIALSDPNKLAQAVFFFSVGGERRSFYLFDQGRPPTNHEVCLESKLEERSKLDLAARRITINSEDALGAELIDVVVALNKALHQQVFPDAIGKWLFTEVSTSRLLVGNSWNRVSLIIDRCLGLKLTRTVIEVDGADAGYLCFSLQPPATSS